MAREAVERTIGEDVYVFHQMDPMRSVKTLVKILKIAGTSLGQAADQVAKSGIDNLMDAEVEEVVGKMDLGSIVASICDRLDENEVEQIIHMMLEQVQHKGKGEVSKSFDLLFKGRVSHLFKVVGAALEVEYADFFGEGSAVQGFLRQAAVNLPT